MKEICIFKIDKIRRNNKEVPQSKYYIQQSLAELSDLDIRAIQYIEKGRFNLSLNIFISVMNVLEFDPSDVIFKISQY